MCKVQKKAKLRPHGLGAGLNDEIAETDEPNVLLSNDSDYLLIVRVDKRNYKLIMETVKSSDYNSHVHGQDWRQDRHIIAISDGLNHCIQFHEYH